MQEFVPEACLGPETDLLDVTENELDEKAAEKECM